MTTREEAFARAAQHVADDLARQAARPAREAALASLGPDATDEQIAAWVAKWRPSNRATNR